MIIDAKILFRLKTLKIQWQDGKTQNLPLNFLDKYLNLNSEIVSFKLAENNFIHLILADGRQYPFEPRLLEP